MAKKPAALGSAPAIDPQKQYRVRLKRAVKVAGDQLSPSMTEILMKGRVFDLDDPDRPGEKVNDSVFAFEEVAAG